MYIQLIFNNTGIRVPDPPMLLKIHIQLYSTPSVPLVPHPWIQPTGRFYNTKMQYVFIGGGRDIQMLTHTVQTCVVQGSTVFTHFPHPPPPPLGTTNLSSVSMSLCLGSKYEKDYSICLSLCAFMQYKALEVHLCCLKQQGFLLFYVSVIFLCVYMCVSTILYPLIH